MKLINSSVSSQNIKEYNTYYDTAVGAYALIVTDYRNSSCPLYRFSLQSKTPPPQSSYKRYV